jgi:hypothetical protein
VSLVASPVGEAAAHSSSNGVCPGHVSSLLYPASASRASALCAWPSETPAAWATSRGRACHSSGQASNANATYARPALNRLDGLVLARSLVRSRNPWSRLVREQPSRNSLPIPILRHPAGDRVRRTAGQRAADRLTLSRPSRPSRSRSDQPSCALSRVGFGFRLRRSAGIPSPHTASIRAQPWRPGELGQPGGSPSTPRTARSANSTS